jgi:soluble lytic murein transglycosylase-like protein
MIAVGASAGIAAWMVQRQSQAAAQDSSAETPDALTQAADLLQTGINAIMPYTLATLLPKNAPYIEALRAAEARYGIPSGLLVAQAWQESRFNSNAVNPGSGAQGIMQFMPATAAEWGVNPFDAYSAIDGAGKYMAWLYRQTGDWRLALAAYNWGIGNVTRKGLASAPRETRDYVASISTNSGALA